MRRSRPWFTVVFAYCMAVLSPFSVLLCGPPARAQEAPSTPAEGSASVAIIEPSEVAHAHPTAEPIEVTIHAESRDGDAASQMTYGRRELGLRPRLRPGDIVEAAPGVFAVQHSGGGKANQYFLRGFDADHGTDIALYVDGVPINMVSHGHGQGYADLHFLIPELVVGLDVAKGPYYAQYGDLATAGAINMRLAEKLDEGFVRYSLGQYGIMRGLALASPDLGDEWRSVVAAELYKDDGPFANAEDLRRFNLFGRLTHDLGPHSKLALTFLSYGSRWKGSGQIPARAVCGEGEDGVPSPESYGAPCIDRFDTIDPTEGGASQRHQAQMALSSAWGDTELSASVYLVKYDFSLYSNFTFFLEDPERGDQIEQVDHRVFGGTDLRLRRHLHLGKAELTTAFGAQTRVDGIQNALYHDQARERLEARSASAIDQSSIGLYVEQDARLTDWLRFLVGVRADRFDVSVSDELDPDEGAGASGTQGSTLFSPKGTVVFSPWEEMDLFANAGRGFHSNDARGAVKQEDRATLLSPATGYELGARLKPTRNLAIEAVGFLIDLGSETVWVGDAGTTEPSGATRRYGVELSGRYHLGNWLYADAEAVLVRPRYRENAGDGDAVALAPTRTFTAGIGARPTLGAYTPFGSVRVKSIADRPANEDGSLLAEGFTTVDLEGGLRWKEVEVGVDIQNLFNATWREVSFATETRLAYEPRSLTGVHYSPGWPFTAVGHVALYFR